MRPSSDTPRPDLALNALAARQFGVLDRADLRACGLTEGAIARRIKSGRLRRLHAGVYAVGPVLTAHGRWLAAVKACGAGAALSHRSAGHLWQLPIPGSRRVEVTVPLTSGVRAKAAIVVHRTRGPLETTTLDGIPVTTLPRTLADLADVLEPRQVEKALEAVEARSLLDVAAIDAIAAAHPGRRGPALVRRLARGDLGHTTRSGLEDAFLELCDRHGIPRPVKNAIVDGEEVDCHWPGTRLIVELDGYGWHRTRAAFRRDRAKTRRLVARGWIVLRLADEEVHTVAPRIAAEILTELARQAAA
jgi:hypothetical protein